MIRRFANWDDHTLDLAIDSFTVGLDEGDEASLQGLSDHGDLQDFENTLAAISLSQVQTLVNPPAELILRMERAGMEYLVANVSSPSAQRGRVLAFPLRALAIAGWLLAAGLLLAMTLFKGSASQDTYAQRGSLITTAGDLVRIEWTATEDPAASSASGDVVWSSTRQEGYMRFRNLSPNDPEQTQYQLWIFDPSRADWEARPVDGGVFNVPTEAEVVVPIDPKLEVRETALFAVTVEAPGGVVVSDRERLVLTAAI
ncbi:MAG: hypothetical protein ACI8QS_000454 [Planctomycetota bacterium]|jgi:hypothetical protein